VGTFLRHSVVSLTKKSTHSVSGITNTNESLKPSCDRNLTRVMKVLLRDADWTNLRQHQSQRRRNGRVVDIFRLRFTHFHSYKQIHRETHDVL